MKKIIIILATAVVLTTLSSCGTKAEKVVLKDTQDSLSWAMGMSLGRTAQSGFYEFDESIMRRAFESTLRGEKQPLSEAAYQEACQAIAFMVSNNAKAQKEARDTEADKLQEEAFQKILAEKPDLKKSDKGYYYEVLRAGKGPNAQEGQIIRFDFKGINMLNNQVIEETYGHRDPIVHNLSRSMFEGLFYALQSMNAGSKYRFYFPYTLVTNANGIPDHTPVIYEVELHEIQK